MSVILALGILGMMAVPALAQDMGGETEPAPHLAALPPELPWSGESRSLALAADHPWATPFEQGGRVDSPSYDDTVAWLERLVAEAPELAMVSLGKSPEGRDLWMVVATAEGVSTPEALLGNGRPTLLAQAGIHSGEIDGKDAGMMLLRDLTVLGKGGDGNGGELLERVNLLFIPIFSVDGHERRSPYSRINQRGPVHMGWRSTARNLNLNRDYAKADSPEMRHLLRALGTWQPDLYLDLHVTDGVDYQYDITYGWNDGPSTWSPAIAGWLDSALKPALDRDLSAVGHIPGPLVFALDDADMSRGRFHWSAGPRYSNGYGDARHLATVLVENHSLKPYEQRVLGTRVLLETSLRVLAEEGEALERATAEDRARSWDTLPLGFTPPAQPEPRTEPFLGVESRRSLSPISGGVRVVWTGELETLEVPVFAATEPVAQVEPPAAYWVPAAWQDTLEVLELHGIEMERIAEPREVRGEELRLTDPELAAMPFEGRVRVSAGVEASPATVTLPPGSARVPVDQPLGVLATLLLEPESPDSLFQWGFFHEVLSQIEYAESYVMEPLAEQMLEDDPALAEAFEQALRSDPELAASPRQRLQWFYDRTPYRDQRLRLYPVVRELVRESAP